LLGYLIIMLKNKLLILILILAAILRLYDLSHFPAGLNADEAALGYNAFSLLTTGMDEHGHPWPVNLESFGDFKPSMYAYILIPFIKIFGLNEFAVRLPSAIVGIISIYLIYLLTLKIFENSKIAAIAGLLLAISPWHLQFSRGAWEVNLASTLILLATYNFILWLNQNKLPSLIISILGFTLSLYSYQSARIFVPIYFLVIFSIYIKHFLSNTNHTFKAGLLGIIIVLPLVVSIIRTGAVSRFSGVGFTADIGPVNRINELRGQHGLGLENILSKFIHNRPVIYTIQFVDNYLTHFDGNFLFVNGDVIQRNKVPETGQLYLIDSIFLVAGIIFLVRKSPHLSPIIWSWLFIAPTASSLTFQVPHALRAQIMLYPLIIIVSAGVYFIARHIKYVSVVIIVIYLVLFSNYLHQYYIHYPKLYPSAWQYGFKEMVAYVNSVQDRYQKVVITDKYDQPYILYLFYTIYPPQKFQKEHVLTPRDKFNFSTVNSFSKFEFTSTPWYKVRDWHDSLIVAAPEDIPDVGVNIVKTINFPNGEPAFKIISN